MGRICMVVYTDYAGDTRVRREAEALVQRGDVVHVVCPKSPRLGTQSEVQGVQLRYTTKLRLAGEVGPLQYLRRYVSFLIAATAKVAVLNARHRYDLIQVHTMPDFLVYAAIIPKLTGAKVILDVHDLVPELYAAKFEVEPSHRMIRLLTWIERKSVAFADRAFAVHRPHLQTLVEHGNPETSFTIIMNSPDPRLIAQNAGPPADGPFRLVYHGYIGRRQGLETAVRAVALTREQLPDLELDVVGDGDDVDRLLALVTELGVGDIVRVSRGVVPMEEVLPVLHNASAGVVPLVADSFTRHMLPVKLLEYVALGLPVICSRTETIEAYFDDSMLAYVRPGSAEDLADRIVELYRDRGRAAGYAARARSVIEQHSWDREKERYLGVIDDLIGAAARPKTVRLAEQ